MNSLLLLSFLATTIATDSVAAPVERTLVLRHATVVDVVGERLIPNQALIIRGKHIASIGADGAVRIPRGATVVDCAGQFVMAGLWDMHIHVPEISSPTSPSAAARMGWDYVSALLIANGVTGARVASGNLKRLQGWRDDVARETMVGPRMVLTGQKLGEQPVVLGAPFPVKTDDDARVSVRQLKGAGADFVKVSSGLPAPLWRAAADEARKLGLPIVGHVPATLPLTEASQLGLRSVEHLINIPRETSEHDAPLTQQSLSEVISRRTGKVLQWLRIVKPTSPLDEAIATHDTAKASAKFAFLHQHGTWATPTLVLTAAMLHEQDGMLAANRRRFMTSDGDVARLTDTRPLRRRLYAAQVLAFNLSLVREMHAAGVDLLAGTDAPTLNIPGFALHDELALLVHAGLTPAEALRAATASVGRFFTTDTLGVLRRGAVADVVVLAENPLRDISATRRIRGVVAAGRYYSRDALDRLLDTAADIAARSRDGGPAAQATDARSPDASRSR